MTIGCIPGPLIGASLGGLLGRRQGRRGGACPPRGSPWTGVLMGGLLGALLIGPLSCRRSADPEVSSPYVQAMGSQQQFQDLLKSPRPVVVDFYATWCGPCRMLAPTIAALAEQYRDRVSFARLDVDKLSTVAQNYQISAIPTVILFQPGKDPQRWVGVQDAQTYRSAIDGALRP